MKPVVKVIYLFAGKRRHSDVGSFLGKLDEEGRIELHLHEVDIERSQEQDLRKQSLWDDIFQKLEQGGWFLIVSPPCNTFSRARFQWEKVSRASTIAQSHMAKRLSMVIQ